jgi:protein O-GlcNAc transferase
MSQSHKNDLKRARDSLERGDFASADISCGKILHRTPHHREALCLLGMSKLMRGSAGDAMPLFKQALVGDDRYGFALEYLGLAHLMLGEYSDAERVLARASMIPGAPPSVHMRYGAALLKLGRYGDATSVLERAAARAPRDADTRLNLAQALAGLNDFVRARRELDIVLAIAPGHPDAMFNIGAIDLAEGRLGEARLWFERVIASAPQYVDAYVNLGIAWQNEGQLAPAIAALTHAISINADSVQAQFNLGQALYASGRMTEAARCYERVLTIEPNHAEALWALTISQLPAVYETPQEMVRCREAFKDKLDQLTTQLARGHVADAYKAVGVLQPFLLAYQERNNRELLGDYGALCTRSMSQWFVRLEWPPLPREAITGKIRVGVVSQHFRKHSVWDAIVKGWFTHLDQEKFELYAFHVGAHDDEDTVLAKTAAAVFVEGPRSLRQWVEVILSKAPDVLLYPEISMDPLTVQLASLRLARIQAASWGHPETSGLGTIDYFLSADLFEPEDGAGCYVEQLVKLPHLGCCYDPQPVTAIAPDALSVRFDRPVLVCPGVPFKYSPEHDHVFTDIAEKLGCCSFVFFCHPLEHVSARLRDRLAAEFHRANLDFEEFVTFVPWLATAEFFGLLKSADVFLDTIGFSGFNTAIQGVQCGIPIVTCEGAFMRGRLASGILRRMALAGLVTPTPDAYVALAVKLASDQIYNAAVRDRIETARHRLFGDVEPIRALERFLAEATGSHRNG